jgi:hypothetical protein
LYASRKEKNIKVITKKKLSAFHQNEKIHEYSLSSREKLLKKSNLNSEEIRILSEIFENIQMANNGVTSESFNQKIIDKIKLNCDKEVEKLLLNKLSLNMELPKNSNSIWDPILRIIGINK